MHKMTSAIAAAALLAVGGSAVAAPRLTPEQKLAKMLEGRVADKPVDCIQLNQIRSSRIIDKTAIVYETNGGKLYVNRPDSGASWLDQNDVLVTDTHSPQLCSIDIVKLYDSASRMQSGSVGLGKFVPYVKPPKR